MKKLLKYCNGTTTFTLLLAISSATTGLPNKLILYLKELELSTVKSAIALAFLVVHLVYIDKELLMNLHNYQNILLNYT